MDAQTYLIGCRDASDAVPGAEVLGFKAYNLWRMHKLGLRVPQAFVLGTRYCREYFDRGAANEEQLKPMLARLVRELERASALGFGSARKPLLVSVRSGAAVSMPGMLDTILNIGLCDSTVPGLLRLTGNPRLVWDNYRRLIESFAHTVHGIGNEVFDAALAECMRKSAARSPYELDFQALRTLTREYLEIFEKEATKPFPQDPMEQLASAVIAVWSSWQSDKAVEYRRLHALADGAGTAVTVQRMVYGNAGGTSGAGVVFTRDPASGDSTLYLDFMFNAQGEDVVSGRRVAADADRLATVMPQVFDELRRVARTLEGEFRDMQEFEFTVQDGTLYVLQTRTGKRTPWAALRIAVDQCEEGLIDRETAIARLAPYDVDRIERVRAVPVGDTRLLCSGVGAGIGVASGEVVLDSAIAAARARAGRSVILVRENTSTDDLVGIQAAAGVLTLSGSRTCHAAVVARQLDKPCVVGCSSLRIDASRRACVVDGHSVAEGEIISIDGHTGKVYAGEVELQVERPTDCIDLIKDWRVPVPTP